MKSQTPELQELLERERPAYAALAPKIARALVRHAKALHRLYEAECSVEHLPESHEATVQRHEKWVAQLCAVVGVRHTFNGDPRGFPVKLHMGTGQGRNPQDFTTQPYNTWGGSKEGWGIG